MIHYLDTFDVAEKKIESMKSLYKRDTITGIEYASAFYRAVTDIESYESIPIAEINRLLDCVSDVPQEVCELLTPMLIEQVTSDYEPVVGVGIRIPVNEQRRRIPHTRFVTEGLLERLNGRQNKG